MRASSHVTASVLLRDIDSLSVKRIAWAFGCAKKGSDEEAALYTLLLDKIERVGRDRVEPML